MKVLLIFSPLRFSSGMQHNKKFIILMGMKCNGQIRHYTKAALK